MVPPSSGANPSVVCLGKYALFGVLVIVGVRQPPRDSPETPPLVTCQHRHSLRPRGSMVQRPRNAMKLYSGGVPPPPPPAVDTTRTRSDPQWVGMCSGERPIGAAKGKPTNTMASCQPLPPPARPDAHACRVWGVRCFFGQAAV